MNENTRNSVKVRTPFSLGFDVDICSAWDFQSNRILLGVIGPRDPLIAPLSHSFRHQQVTHLPSLDGVARAYNSVHLLVLLLGQGVHIRKQRPNEQPQALSKD
jgi:hypothetical protein